MTRMGKETKESRSPEDDAGYLASVALVRSSRTGWGRGVRQPSATTAALGRSEVQWTRPRRRGPVARGASDEPASRGSASNGYVARGRPVDPASGP